MFFGSKHIPNVDKGRSKIDNPSRQSSYSKRAKLGNIDIIKKRCNECGHNKAIVYLNGRIKCTKCKR